MSRPQNCVRGLLLVLLTATALIFSPLVTATPHTNDPVVLYVSVATEKGDAILDLTRDDFAVNIEKRPQTVLSVGGETPASIGILIDTSGSIHRYDKKLMVSFKQHLKDGLERFVQLGHPGNEYFVMTFNKETALLQDWTSEHPSITNKLDALEFKGLTRLYDAIPKAIEKVGQGRHNRHVLVIISDGHDSDSKNEQKHAREALKRSDVVVYAVGIISDFRYAAEESERVLGEFSKNSGGRPLFSLHFANAPAFTEALESFALELRSQYQLVISAAEAANKEKWHKLNVTVARNDPSGRPQKLIVRTRKGYYR